MHRELLAEGVRRLALPGRRVQLSHAVADLVERGAEVREVLGRRPDRLRVAVDQIGRQVGVAELLLARRGTELRGDPVAGVLHHVGVTVGADVVQALPDEIGALVDALADQFLARVDDIADLAQTGVDQIADAHQPASPPCCRSAVLARSSAEGPNSLSRNWSYSSPLTPAALARFAGLRPGPNGLIVCEVSTSRAASL